MLGCRRWSPTGRVDSPSLWLGGEAIDKAATTDEVPEATVDVSLESGEILDECEGAIDGLGLCLRVEESLRAIDAALVDEEVFAATDRRHVAHSLGLLYSYAPHLYRASGWRRERPVQ
jgi:hypothetical protein